jgi:hypothetical protein
MKRGAFLKRATVGAVALTAGGSLIPAAGHRDVNWTRPLVRIHPDGRHEVLWWPGKDEKDAAVRAETGGPILPT